MLTLSKELEDGLVEIRYNDAVMCQHAQRMSKEYIRLNGAFHVWKSFDNINCQVFAENPYRGKLMYRLFWRK